MRTADMVKSKFFRAIDVKGQPPIRLTIAHVTEELIGQGQRQEMKCFLWFQDHMKGLQLNKSRVAVLEAAYGPDSDLWVGKRVRLVFDPTVMFAGQAVGGVKLETPPGVFYTPGASPGAWGDAPAPAPVPGRPPPPAWDAERGQWITPAPPAAAKPNRPPPPVWNEATQSYDVVNPATGEITGSGSQHNGTTAPPPQGRPMTISERVNQGPPNDEWGAPATAGSPDFDDPIPF